jgi:cell division septation protein DedD
METVSSSDINQDAVTQTISLQTPVIIQVPDNAAVSVSSQSPAARLQAGVFSRQSNADELIAKLKQAGFNPALEQRLVNGSVMWAVTVPAGSDVNIRIRELRDAGFDSFPVK